MDTAFVKISPSNAPHEMEQNAAQYVGTYGARFRITEV